MTSVPPHMGLAPGWVARASNASCQLPGWRNSTCAPPSTPQHHRTLSIEEGRNTREVVEHLCSVHLPTVGERVPILYGPAELGDHTLSVGLDELLLVAPDVVHVNFVEAQIHVVLDVLQMLVEVGACEDTVLEVLDGDLLRHRREVLGVADVGLGEWHPAVWPLAHGLLLGLLLVFGPGDVQLDHARHSRGVLVLLARPLLELLHEHLDLLVRGADGDDPVTVPACALALDRAGGS